MVFQGVDGSLLRESVQLAEDLNCEPTLIELMMETADDISLPQTWHGRVTILPCDWWNMERRVRNRKINRLKGDGYENQRMSVS